MDMWDGQCWWQAIQRVNVGVDLSLPFTRVRAGSVLPRCEDFFNEGGDWRVPFLLGNWN